MIPERFLPRFKGDSGIDIATESIDAVFPDGQRVRVVLRLGSPYKKEAEPDDWHWIRVELENLDRTDGPVGGEGPFGAIACALGFIRGRLEVFARKHGCRYFLKDSDEPFYYELILEPRAEQASDGNAEKPPGVERES